MAKPTTKTITITEAEAPALTVRGDVLDVLAGYRGDAIVNGDPAVVVGVSLEHSGTWVCLRKVDPGQAYAQAGEIELPVVQPLVQAHLVGWLGRGAWCPVCDGGGFDGPVETATRYGCPSCGGGATKRGSGYARTPTDVYHLLKPFALGGSPGWIRAVLIWGNVTRVAGGMPPIDGVYAHFTTKRYYGPGDRCAADFDARRLVEGHALVDDTTAGRVIRFGVPE